MRPNRWFPLVAVLLLLAPAALAEEPPDREALLRRLAGLDAERERILEKLDRLEPAPAPPETPEPPPAPEPRPEPPPGVTLLEEMIVVAKRYEEDAGRVTSAVDRIGPEDFERRQAVQVTDVLAEVPGVEVRQTGAPGQSTIVFLRGAAGTQTLVLLDGIPMNNYASSGVFDASGFTASAIESAEVLRGSYGLLYGSEAIGGVVSMESRRGRGAPGGFLRVEGGSFGTHREVLGFGGSEAAFDYALTLSHFRTRGDEKRSEHHTTELVGRFGLDLRPDLRLDQTVYFAESEAEKPFGQAPWGGPLPREPNEKNGLDRLAAGLNLTWDPAAWLAVRLHGSVLRTEHANDDGANGPTTFDPDGEPDSGDEFDRVIDEFHGTRDQRDWRLRGSATVFANDLLGWRRADEGGVELELTVGGEYLDQTTRELQQYPDPTVTTGPSMIATHLDANVQTEAWYLLGQVAFPAAGWLRGGVLNAGLRRDRHTAFGRKNSLFAGARVTLDPTDTTFRAARGEGFRAPVPTELYGPYFSNPDLGPETSESFDVGLSQPLFDRRVVLSATWYHLEIENTIGFDFVERHLDNFPDGTRSRGWEYAAEADLGRGFRLRGTWHVQNNRDVETGIGYGTKRSGSAGISFEHGPLLLSLDGTFASALHDFDLRYTSPDGDARKSPGRRYLVNLAARYRATECLTVFGRIENLLNDDYVVVPWASKGLPIGGYLGFRWDF